MMNSLELQKVANKSETSKAMFKSWASRDRFRRHTNLKRFVIELLNGGNKIVDSDYKMTLVELQTLGIGKIINGRNGNPRKFVWNYNLKDIGLAGMGKKSLPIHQFGEEPVQKVKRGRPRKDRSEANVAPNRDTFIPLPNSQSSESRVTININLPHGFNREDLSDLLKNVTKIA